MEFPPAPAFKPIPVSSAKAMPKAGEPGGPVLLEATDESKKMIEDFERSLAAANDPVAREKGLALQRQIKAHTVFTVGGNIVALQEANGWALFKENRFMGVFDKEPKHLAGRALADHRSKVMEAALRSVYGEALKVHDYADDPNAPTNGQLAPALWEGKSLDDVLSARASTRKGPNPLLAMTAGTISLFHGRRD